ncbi:membrane protein [Rhizoctonia solani]|uniref:Membrane protein n=1 Tax=Rhizoctonia solani TaxID=456999 RepID=A0A8H8NYE2_9AGAM|nr:uncharacterized protein RhiXN_05605 [Rhizoctonia solani]QRW20616.1 membrane protein [Rhizoctonia solani]
MWRTSEFTVLQTVGLDAAVLLSFFKMSFYLFSVCSLVAIGVIMPMNYVLNGKPSGDPDDDGEWLSMFELLTVPPTNTIPSASFIPKKPQDRSWLDLVSDASSHLTVHLLLTYLFTALTLRFCARAVNSLDALLAKRTDALLKLENAWTDYVGNPSIVESYDPSLNVRGDAVSSRVANEDGGESGGLPRLVVPHRPRPTLRPSWFGRQVDALEWLESRFREADEIVRRKRRLGKFDATDVAFVTFEEMASAQIAAQVEHNLPSTHIRTAPAPEPRDIYWPNVTLSPRDMDPRIQALVQNSLPSFSVTALNSLLPFLLEALSYLQGNKARSWAEYALLKKYFLFLLINVVFIFLLASTYWALVRDLANAIKVPEKLAQALQRGQARHFFLSYVMLQALGIMPLQLLNIGIIVPRVIYQLFTKTPRDYAELNAPPMINYGVVYPLAILVFVITIIYSIIQPLILIFGAVYFGMAYLVYKYKLMFVFYKPAESRGEAWPITFRRLMWGLTFPDLHDRDLYLETIFCTCLLNGSTYLRNSVVDLVDRQGIRATEYLSPEDERTDYSQQPMANWYWGVLNTGRRRYGHPVLTGVLPTPWLPLKKGQTLANYIEAQSSEGGPADKGDAVVLTLRKRRTSRQRRDARRSSRAHTPGASSAPSGHTDTPGVNDNPWREDSTASGSGIQSANGSQNPHKLVYDHATGVIMLPEDSDWMGEDESSADEGPGPLPTETLASPRDEESLPTPTPRSPLSPSANQNRYSTYFHHPERRRSRMPGGFPRS